MLDTLKANGFSSLLDFILQLFTNEDPIVRRRVGLLYARGGAQQLMDIFMKNKKARENGGDTAAVAWATRIFKDEFDAGLVKGGVRCYLW